MRYLEREQGPRVVLIPMRANPMSSVALTAIGLGVAYFFIKLALFMEQPLLYVGLVPGMALVYFGVRKLICRPPQWPIQEQVDHQVDALAGHGILNLRRVVAQLKARYGSKLVPPHLLLCGGPSAIPTEGVYLSEPRYFRAGISLYPQLLLTIGLALTAIAVPLVLQPGQMSHLVWQIVAGLAVLAMSCAGLFWFCFGGYQLEVTPGRVRLLRSTTWSGVMKVCADVPFVEDTFIALHLCDKSTVTDERYALTVMTPTMQRRIRFRVENPESEIADLIACLRSRLIADRNAA